MTPEIMADPSPAVRKQIRKVALYVYANDADARLLALRKAAADRGWDVSGEFVDQEFPGAALDRLIVADHEHQHDGVILWIGKHEPRFVLNGHVSGATAVQS